MPRPVTPRPAARVAHRRIDGVLLLDKLPGLSSNAALQRAKRLFTADKAGHTGTLDPLASGLLPLCFGEATKFAHALLDARKEYVATLCFGRATTTGDSEGRPLNDGPIDFARADLEAVLPRFLGRVLQLPPRYAALKHQGRSFYEYARAGIEIPRVPREIEIEAIEIVDWALPTVVLRVACGKGTYIRTLAEDLAVAVGSCAHLAALVRTQSGPFTLDRAITLDRLEALAPDAREACLLPVDASLVALPRLVVDAVQARALSEGRTVAASSGKPGRYRCYGPQGRFVGTVEIGAGNQVRAVRLMRADGGAQSDPQPGAGDARAV